MIAPGNHWNFDSLRAAPPSQVRGARRLSTRTPFGAGALNDHLSAILSQQPLVLLPAIHDPVDIHRVVFNLIQNQIPILCIQLVILIGWHVVLKGGSARSFPQSGSASS